MADPPGAVRARDSVGLEVEDDALDPSVDRAGGAHGEDDDEQDDAVEAAVGLLRARLLVHHVRQHVAVAVGDDAVAQAELQQDHGDLGETGPLSQGEQEGRKGFGSLPETRYGGA